jgi:biotin carboxyl carrier protein
MKEYKYKINGNEYNVAIDNIEGNIAHIQLNGVAYDVELPEQPKAAPAVKRVAVSEAPAAAPKPAARKAAPAAGGGHVIESPLPGVIKDIFVKVGQQVKADDVVCILEAMKLMNEIQSDFDGIVDKILVTDGQPVEYDQPVMVIK